MTDAYLRNQIDRLRADLRSGERYVQFEAGARGGELYDLWRGDVFDGEQTLGIHVDGKRGERAVHLIASVPHLQAWLNDSRCSDDPDAWLWSKLNGDGRPSYNNFLQIFKNGTEIIQECNETLVCFFVLDGLSRLWSGDH